MNKVYCLCERYRGPKGLVYPIESAKNRIPKLKFYIEEDEKRKLYNKYNFYVMKFNNKEHFPYIEYKNLSLSKIGRNLLEVKYNNMSLIYTTRKAKSNYVGTLTGPKNNLRELIHKMGPTQEDLFIYHRVLLLGHSEKPPEEEV